MCIIIAKPVGAIIPADHIIESAKTNQDGIGVSYKKTDGTIGIEKYMHLEEFMAIWEPDLARPEIEMVVHLRIATHGKVSLDNVHPFRTSQGYALHHNGIIQCPVLPGKTDSESFTRRHIDGMTPKTIQRQTWRNHIEKMIGESKLALHTDTGILLFNEDLGHWNDGVWYSNHGYERFDTGWGNYTGSLFRLGSSMYDDPADVLEILEDSLPNTDPTWKSRIISEVADYIQAAEWIQEVTQ
jgi:hypothetical protein